MLYDDYSNEGNHKTLHFLEAFYDLLDNVIDFIEESLYTFNRKFLAWISVR